MARLLHLCTLLTLSLLVGGHIVKRQTGEGEEESICPENPADVVLIIDESSSIGANNWVMMIEFLVAFVESFEIGPDNFLFGAVTFDTTAHLQFQLDAHPNVTNLTIAINDLVYEGRTTNIADGLRKANILFDPLLGDRDGVPNVAILFTDGAANQETGNTLTEATLLKEKGVSIICIGISNGVNMQELTAIASRPEWVILIESFDDLLPVINAVAELACDATEGVDSCRRCEEYDKYNYGYMPDEESCYSYYICQYNPETETSEKVFSRECPIGTRFKLSSAKYGVPCVHADSEDECADDRIPQDHEELPCPFTTHTENPSRFGVVDFAGEFGPLQGCGEGGTFDDTDGVCRCDVIDDCQCMLWQDFTGDVQDHSCTKGWVDNRSPKVKVVDGGVDGQGGRFRGLKKKLKNGAHLTTHVLDGAFSTTCDGEHGQRELTVALWFRYQSEEDKVSGLVSYCDSLDGASIFMEIREDNVVCGGLRTTDQFLVEVCSETIISKDVWYYTALVYDDPQLSLYVTTFEDYSTCADPVPGPTCQPAAIANQTGCVQPRACGFNTGVTGNALDDDQFFVGIIDEVQVSRKARYYGCL